MKFCAPAVNTGQSLFLVGLTAMQINSASSVQSNPWVSHDQCYLVYAYAKNVAADLTLDQLKRLADVIDVEVNHGQ